MNWLGACLSVEEDQVMILCVTPGIVESGQQKEVRAERKLIVCSLCHTY